MKLSNLRGAIRSQTGNPSILMELAPGKKYWVPMQKNPLLDALGEAFGGDGSAETGMDYEVTGEKGGRLHILGNVRVTIGDDDDFDPAPGNAPSTVGDDFDEIDDDAVHTLPDPDDLMDDL